MTTSTPSILKIRAGQYHVALEGYVFGIVDKNEKTGMWEAYLGRTVVMGESVSGWFHTRKEAVASLVEAFLKSKEEVASEEVVTEAPAVEEVTAEPEAETVSYEVGDVVLCTWGSNKGTTFIVKAILKNGNYSCIRKDGIDNKYYEYTNTTLKKVGPPAYKIYNTETTKMKTFNTKEEMDAFLSDKNTENTYVLALELREVYDTEHEDLKEASYTIYTGKYGEALEHSETYLYAHVDIETGERSYTWTIDFGTGSPYFETVNKCLKHFMTTEPEDSYDRVDCKSCGDGGCIHCTPSWFI